MTLRKRTRLALLVSAAVVATTLTSAAQRAVSTGPHDAPLTQAVPVDPQITVGTLPNGLRYYVRANKRPLGRAELRLAVNAGAILEDDDQRGLAHFVEHMCFNGTRHFPKQDVVAFLQSTGMRFGAHINANTSFDQTVYQLQIPTEDPAVIDRSLLILEDWAHDVSFEPEEIEKERGVILEEWRQGLGAGQRMLDVQFPIMLQGSRYADRLPIGKPEIIRSFTRDRLTKFYTDWYRPDLMAVIAVGDFDPAAVEALIRKHFSSIPAAASPKTRPLFEVPDHPGTRYTVATDPEATATTIGVHSTMAARDQTTIGSYRQMTVERIFSGLLSARLAEMAQKPGAPFMAANTSRGIFVRSTEATSLSALVTEDGIEKGLTALFTEADRVARFGFTATELDRFRLAYGRSFEQLASSKDEHTSVSLADEFVRNFIQQEPIPGIAYENGLVKRFMPEITLQEINGLAREWMPDRNRVVVVEGPDLAHSALLRRLAFRGAARPREACADSSLLGRRHLGGRRGAAPGHSHRRRIRVRDAEGWICRGKQGGGRRCAPCSNKHGIRVRLRRSDCRTAGLSCDRRCAQGDPGRAGQRGGHRDGTRRHNRIGVRRLEHRARHNGRHLHLRAQAAGIPLEVLHRIAAMASGGMDTLPHNGAVITLLAVTGLTHKESYKDIFGITLIKTAAVAVAILAFYLTGIY